MDRLFLAAQTGNIEDLQQLLQENPFILHTVSLQSVQNPLHLACLFGHLEFAKELLRLKPEFAKELNPDGFSPLHLATANGHEKIAREIIRLDPELCGLTGREKKTAFHIAAVKGKAEIVSEMLAACGECIEDVTVQKESALHLAVKNSQFESLKVMLDWVRLKKKDEVFSMKDEQGNTILHLAVWKKQMQVLQLLLDYATTSSDINGMNQSGLTPLDLLLIFPSEAGDRELLELLHSAGAVRARDISVLISEPHQNREVIGTSTNLLDYFKFHKERDSPSDVRTILLIIAVLVATATYQVGINPPGGSWQDDSPTGTNTTSPGKGHIAGTSIMGTNNIVGYTMLVASNSIGFSLSVTMIGLLTSNFPLQVELQICLMALSFTYNISLINIAPSHLRSFNVVCTSVVPAVISVTAFWMRKYRLWKVVGDLLRRGN